MVCVCFLKVTFFHSSNKTLTNQTNLHLQQSIRAKSNTKILIDNQTSKITSNQQQIHIDIHYSFIVDAYNVGIG